MHILTTNAISDFRFLRLDWRVLKPITHIPSFQGVLWSSLLRHAYNSYLGHGERFFKVGLRLAAQDLGRTRFRTGSTLHLYLALPREEEPRLARVIAALNGLPGLHGQFQPGVTLQLLRVVCRLSGRPWPANPATSLHPRRFERAVARLSDRDRFQLRFHGPLRLTMPPHKKNRGRYAGPAFFREDPEAAQRLLAPCQSTPPQDLAIENSCLQWIDVDYGRTTRPKVLGGVRGDLTLRGRLPIDAASLLITHQFLGFGKNRAFGFGNFSLIEIAPHLGIAPLPHNRRERPGRQPQKQKQASPVQLLTPLGEDLFAPV